MASVRDLGRLLEIEGENPARDHIAEALSQFLSEQRARLAPKTFANYEYAIELLQHSLNGYACQSLDRAETKLFDRLYNANGDEHREFCEIFGPEHILANVEEFLGYFMVRKVIAGKESLRAVGTATRKLAAWLAEKGYVNTKDAEEAAERGSEAARNLPKAQELASLLHEFAEDQERGDGPNEIEDHFTVTRVELGKIWIEGMLDGREVGPIEVSADISRRCKVRWSISGVVGRVGKQWRIVEAWNVYPG